VTGRAAVAIGKIPHVNFRARLLEEKQRTRHHELYIIRMRGCSQNHVI
jgi:hypothetical protein